MTFVMCRVAAPLRHPHFVVVSCCYVGDSLRRCLAASRGSSPGGSSHLDDRVKRTVCRESSPSDGRGRMLWSGSPSPSDGRGAPSERSEHVASRDQLCDRAGMRRLRIWFPPERVGDPEIRGFWADCVEVIFVVGGYCHTGQSGPALSRCVSRLLAWRLVAPRRSGEAPRLSGITPLRWSRTVVVVGVAVPIRWSRSAERARRVSRPTVRQGWYAPVTNMVSTGAGGRPRKSGFLGRLCGSYIRNRRLLPHRPVRSGVVSPRLEAPRLAARRTSTIG